MLRQHVDRLAGLIGPRHLGKPSTMAATQTLIENELTQAGYIVTKETYLALAQPVFNLIVELPGTRRPDEILVVGAHYDTVSTTPGADDNASAVAVLIEVAKRLQGKRFQRTVRLIALACEEPPHYHLGEMGSQIHARGCRERNEKVVGMLALEMLGYFRDEPGSQQIPKTIPKLIRWFIPTKANFVAAVGNLSSCRLLWKFRRGFKRSTKLPLLSLALPEKIEEIRRSDNSSFWDQGYPALMITDTSFLRNPHYHQPTDTPDTLDYERMAEVVPGVCGAIVAIAGG